MCQYKSAIVVRDEASKGGIRLLMSPWTESHSELITIFKLKDGDRLTFARVEFTPSSMDKAYLVEEYALRLDEERKPDWWNAEIEADVTDRMRVYIKSIIVDGDVALLIGGQFVVAPGAKVECANAMVISAMCGGTLNYMWGGTLNDMRGGTLNDMRGGTLNAMWGGTLNDIVEWFSGLIKNVSKSATIIRDNRPKPIPAPATQSPEPKAAKKAAKKGTSK